MDCNDRLNNQSERNDYLVGRQKMLVRSELRNALTHEARDSSRPRKTQNWDFRAVARTVVAKAKDGHWVTRGRQLHS